MDCADAPGTCELVVATGAGATILARHALAFDPSSPLPNPEVTVAPSTGLVSGQTVTVAGAGFAADDFLLLRECAVGDLVCSSTLTFAVSVADGTFSAPYVVRLRVGDGEGGATHCLAVACELRVSSAADPDYDASFPLTFDPNQPLPPLPAIVVTPATGLLHDQVVMLTGSGFDPGSYIDLAECGDADSRNCVEYVANAQADAAGAFSVTAPLSRLVSAYTLPTFEFTTVDCAVGPCSVSATSWAGDEGIELRANAPIAFDGTVPPPALPQADVTPRTNLPYRAQVAVHGSGFRPGSGVGASFCLGSESAGGCGFSFDFGTADAAGEVDLTLAVKRRISFGDSDGSLIDCLDEGTECSVTLQGERRYERAEVPLTFDPNAPIPPPPSATVIPDHDLGWRQVVGFGGSGFTPGLLTVQQCGVFETGPVGFNFCTGFDQVEVTAEGNMLGSFTVQRVLDAGYADPASRIDCATSAESCTLRFGNGDPDESADVPLDFDPESEPPPPPVLTLTPSTHLHDGRPVILQGSGFTPGSLIGLAPCKSGVTSIADDCDLGRAFTATSDAAGDFILGYTPQGVIGTSNGVIDCTSAPGTCVLASANATDLREFGSTPLSIDGPDLVLHDAAVIEGTGTMTVANVMVELSEPIGSPTTVEWRAAPGTAGEMDYMSRSGRAVIPAGETMALIPARVMGDAIDEPIERFSINVTAALGTNVVDGTARVVIVDDDPKPVVTTKDMTFVEGDNGTKIGVVPVWLSAPSEFEVTVSYRTRRGTARPGSDFVSRRGDVVIPPGQTGAFIVFDIVGDRTRERTEWFGIELRRARHGELADHFAQVTITDND